MNKQIFLKIVLYVLCLICFENLYAQKPANDSCHKSKILKIGNSGFGIGSYQSDSINIDSATVQVGEFFHSSLITAGNDKRSIWFKFYLPTRRGILLELKQNANKIAIKDCGFTTYFSNTCLPGSSAATAAKLTTLNQFGSSFHPCMDPGWYMVQVSAKTRAAGKVYLEVTTSFPYENSAITNAKYDAKDSAYNFGNNLVGQIRNNSNYIDFELGCYTVKDSTELFKPIGKNYAAYNQSAWFVFKAKDNSDFTQIKLSAPWACFGANDTAAFRLFKGDCRKTSGLQLLDSNFNDFSNASLCYPSNCYDVARPYKCFFDSGQYYSFQLLFHKDIDRKIRLTIESHNSEFDSGYYQPKLGIAKNLGVIKGATSKNVGFSCGSYINNYSCSNAMPAGGVKQNGWRYNLNQWVTFKLTEQTRLELFFRYNYNSNSDLYYYTGFRLFKDTITNNCNDIDTNHIIFRGIGTINYTIDCLDPGDYTIQLLGTDTIPKANYWACNGSYHLGRDYTLDLNANKLPTRNRFSLYAKGEADSINVINNKIEALPKWKYIYAKTDTIACNNTLMPESSCDTFLTKAIYRVFKIGDVTGDAIADSGMLQINSLILGSYPQYRGNHRLYKGNALTLRDNQSVSSYPQKLTGLKPLNECMGKYTSSQFICIEPGEYTIASFFDNTSIGLTEKPYFYFYHARSKFDTYAKAEFIDSLKSYKTYYSQADTFTCLNNRDTIDGVSCGVKNSYHVFYLDSIAVTTIASPTFYYNTIFSLFKGDIRKGKSGLKLYEDNSGKWKCLNSYYWGKTTTQCEPLLPGWYTIMASRDGADYDSAKRVDYNGYSLYAYPKNFYITTSKPSVVLPKFNRPFKAAFVDSLINKNKPLSYDTNYSTKAMPQHLAEFKFPTERFECDLDTPINHFPKSILCDNKTTDIAYYVFTLKKNAFVRLVNNVGYSAKVKMYNFDVRKDSAKLATATPIQNCNYNATYFEFCNLKPGKYTLVYFIKRTSGVTATISPVMYIDSIATSRFDHAKNTYDFGSIPGTGQWVTGKKGDVHPINSSLPASHDLVTCKTGAQFTDPTPSICYVSYNPNVYLKDTNAVMYPYDSAMVRYKGNDLYYNYYNYPPQRNLWYSFIVNGKGTVTVALNTIDQTYNPYANKGYNFRFSIYESDEDGSLSLDSLKKTGKLDSTTASGLKFIATDYYVCYYPSDMTETFVLPSCGASKPKRYYVVVDINNLTGSMINSHISLQVKYDSVFVPETKYDHYSQANIINGFNKQNILINGNAEQNNSIGWNGSSGFIQYNSPAPKEGNYCFWGYYIPSSNTELSQTVDVSQFSSYIDAGKAKTTFSGYIQSASQTNPDETQLVLEYLNASGSVISSSQSGFKANIGSWLKETLSNTTPANTRKLRVSLQSRDKNSDYYHYTYFDNMILLQEVDTVKSIPPLKSGIVYSGNIDYFSSATLDTADYGKYYPYCGGNNGTVWYKFKVDSTGYLYYNFINSYLSGDKLLTTNQYSEAYIRLFKNITPGDSLSGLVYQPYISGSSNFTSKMDYTVYTCVSPGWYYLQINKCNQISCSDYAYPRLLFDFHRGDYCKSAIPLNIDTIESVSNRALVNCHTIGTDFGEDGSNMGCLFGPKGYKSSWFVVDYTDTTKVDLEFKMAENTNAKSSEIRYRTYYGNCQSLTPAPCNNNALTSFTLNCIKKGTYYVQVVTPDNANGEIQLTVEAKKNTDTTCNPINIFQPNAVFYYNTSCPENIVEFINTSSRGDSIRYLWDFGYNNKKDTGLNPYFAYPPLKQEKDYTVKLVVRNIARGTKDSLSITVTVPFAPFIDISNKDTAICVGDSVTLKASLSHGKGIWSTGDTSSKITVNKTDWYYYRMQQSPKLLINANAESAPTSKGWTAISGNWTNQSGYFYAQDSNYFFETVNTYTAGTYELYQVVDISKDSMIIDAGLGKTSLISYVQTYPEATPDQGQVILEYYDSKNNLLAIYQSGIITNIGSWLKLTHSRTTPPKTRKLKVILQAINTVSATPTYAFFDNIILKMRSACNYEDSVYVQVNPLPEVKFGKDTSFCWHDSVLLKPKVDYTNPYLANEPMNTATLSGKLISSATYNTTNKYLTLTPSLSYKYGNIEWDLNSLKLKDTFNIGFDFWTGNATNCKYGTLNLYLFNSSSPTGNYQNTGGYSITFDEYYNQIQINWEGTRIRTISTSLNFNNETWYKVKVIYKNQRFLIYIDGILIDNYFDATTRTQTGYKAGMSGTTNYYGCAIEHRIKKFYLTQNNPSLVVIPAKTGRSFTFTWNDSKTDSMRYVKSTKTFIIKVTDNNKCLSKPDTIKVTSIKTYDSLLTGMADICSELDTFRLLPFVKGGSFYGHKAVNNVGLVKVDSATYGTNTVFYTVKDTKGCNYIDTGFFKVDSVPNITVNTVKPVCRNSNSFKLTVNNTTGFFYGGSYVDSAGNFNPKLTTKKSNKVYYRTKQPNCVGRDTITITVDSIPNASITAAGPFCKNAGIKTIVPKVNTGGKFSGNFIDSTGKFNPLNANKGNNKIYYTFKDGNSCSNKDSILIKVDTIPNAAITAAGPFCKNAGIKTIVPKVNTGGTFSGGSFINAAGSFNPANAAKGNNKIYYTFKDGNSCSNKDSILIRVDSIPNAAITVAGPFCKNAGIKTITAKYNTGGIFSGGSFINATGSFNPTNANKGNNKIYYTFKDGNSCSNKDSILIRVDTIPIIGLNAAGPFCNLDNNYDLSCKNLNLTYIYYGGTFINTIGRFFPNQALIGTNKIFALGTDKNGCTNKDSINIIVFKIPDASINPLNEICEDSASIQIVPVITGGKFSGGSFISGTGIFYPPISKAGFHKVYYDRSTNGCFAKDSIIITVRPVPIKNVSISPLAGCEPMEVVLKSKGGYKCEWKSNGNIINNIDSFKIILMKGLYNIDLKLTTQYGCIAKEKNTITVNPKPTAAFIYMPNEIFARLTSVEFINKSMGAITGSEWFVDGVLFNTKKDATNQFADTGYFDLRLIVSNAQGCKDTAYAKLYVIDEFRVFIPNIISPNGDGLNDSFFPSGIGIDKVQLQIFDRWGEKLHDGNEKWDCTYKSKPVQDGSYLYFLTIIDSQGMRHFLKGSVTVLR